MKRFTTWRVAAIGGLALVLLIAIAVVLLTRDSAAPGVRGSRVLMTKTYEVERFDRVAFMGIGTARLAIGEPQHLQVTTDDNLFGLLSVDVQDGTLTVRNAGGMRPSELLVAIRVPELRGVALQDNPTVEVPHVAGSRFAITVTGHGTAEVSGSVDDLTVKITGNGLVRAAGLRARRAEVEITGAGDVAVHAIDALAVTCVGSGNVRYSGAPALTVRGPASIQRVR
jgi:hypothetical protein